MDEDACVTPLIVALVTFALLLMMTACGKTVYVPVETVRTDSVKVTRIQRDSIHVTDSVYIYAKADTVFREKWRTVYRDITRTDTAYIQRTDTIQVPYPVERKLTTWQKLGASLKVLLIAVGCAGVIGIIAWMAKKKLKK